MGLSQIRHLVIKAEGSFDRTVKMSGLKIAGGAADQQ